MTDDICIVSKFRDPEICDIEDAVSASREENRVVIAQKFESEDILGVSLLWNWLGTDEMCVKVSFVDSHNPMA